MKEFDGMSVKELEYAKRILERELCYQYEISENIIDYKEYVNKLEEINNIELQYELVLECLGEL
jgi:hypothetical protein